MKSKFGGILCVAGVLSVALAACGGGGPSGGGENRGLSEVAFRKQANAICDRTVQTRSNSMEAISEEISAGSKPTSVDAERKALLSKAIIPSEKKMVAELAKLAPPASDEDLIHQIIEGLKSGIERIEAEPNVAFEPVVVTHADVLAERYGLPECRV